MGHSGWAIKSIYKKLNIGMQKRISLDIRALNVSVVLDATTEEGRPGTWSSTLVNAKCSVSHG